MLKWFGLFFPTKKNNILLVFLPKAKILSIYYSSQRLNWNLYLTSPNNLLKQNVWFDFQKISPNTAEHILRLDMFWAIQDEPPDAMYGLFYNSCLASGRPEGQGLSFFQHSLVESIHRKYIFFQLRTFVVGLRLRFLIFF